MKLRTNQVIAARLRAYDDAVKAGSTPHEAFKLATKITRASLRKAERFAATASPAALGLDL